MRLDHLLSREQGKLETASRNPRSNRVNSPEKAFCGESGGNPAKPSKRQGEKSPMIVVRVSYIVFRVRAQEHPNFQTQRGCRRSGPMGKGKRDEGELRLYLDNCI